MSPAVPDSVSALPAPPATPGRRSSGNHAAEYIRRLIFDGQLKPGERVPQDDVAEALSFSRIPVREGLIALEREGWVTIELNRGAFVNTLDADAVRDSYELFGVVYGLAAKRALARSEEGFVDRLTAIEKQLRATDDPAEMEHLAIAFHNTIVEAARSPRIKVVLRASTGLVAGNFFEEVDGSIEVEQKGTAAIVRAIRKGDGEKAAAEYLAMLRRQGELVVKTFEGRGLFSPR
jgi:DNA-binding GntR family transcriptional regulator